MPVTISRVSFVTRLVALVPSRCRDLIPDLRLLGGRLFDLVAWPGPRLVIPNLATNSLFQA